MAHRARSFFIYCTVQLFTSWWYYWNYLLLFIIEIIVLLLLKTLLYTPSFFFFFAFFTTTCSIHILATSSKILFARACYNIGVNVSNKNATTKAKTKWYLKVWPRYLDGVTIISVWLSLCGLLWHYLATKKCRVTPL